MSLTQEANHWSSTLNWPTDLITSNRLRRARLLGERLDRPSEPLAQQLIFLIMTDSITLNPDQEEIVRKLAGTSLVKYAKSIADDNVYQMFNAERLCEAYLHYLIEKKSAAHRFHYALTLNNKCTDPKNVTHSLSVGDLALMIKKADKISDEFWRDQSAAADLRATAAPGQPGSLRSLIKAMINEETLLREMLTRLAAHQVSRELKPGNPRASKPSKASSRLTDSATADIVKQLPSIFPAPVSSASLDAWNKVTKPCSTDKLSGKEKARYYARCFYIDMASISDYGSVGSSGDYIKGKYHVFQSPEEHMRACSQSPAKWAGLNKVSPTQVADFLNKLLAIHDKKLELENPTVTKLLDMYGAAVEGLPREFDTQRPRAELDAVTYLAKTLSAFTKSETVKVETLENTFNRSTGFNTTGLPVLCSLAAMASSTVTPAREASTWDVLFKQYDGGSDSAFASSSSAAAPPLEGSEKSDTVNSVDEIRKRINLRHEAERPTTPSPVSPPTLMLGLPKMGDGPFRVVMWGCAGAIAVGTVLIMLLMVWLLYVYLANSGLLSLQSGVSK